MTTRMTKSTGSLRVCPTCKTLFKKKSNRQTYCEECGWNKTKGHAARKLKRKNHILNFISVDGEGVPRPDFVHDYILLSVGDKSLHGDNGERLQFPEIMEFLWNCYLDNKDSVFVGFYLGYDFTHWLKDLPENRARMLLTKEGKAKRARTRSGPNRIPFPVEYAGWEFDTLGMKRFKLRPAGSGESWMYICDTGAFFQTSLLNVINPKNWDGPDGAILTDEEYEIILAGKKDRGVTTVPYGQPVDPIMIQYNILENDVLSRLMNRYNDGMVKIDVNLNKRQWFGPGQAAQEWMNNVDVPTREDYQLDNFILECGRCSYYGGWFEIFAHGHVHGSSHVYDINSAYPYIMSTLPCLLHGEWNICYKAKDLKPGYNLCLMYATVTGSDEWIGAAPHRTKQGRILRPYQTKGWYWSHELDSATAAGLIDTIEVEVYITYAACNCDSPFRGLRELYDDRIRLGKNTPEGKARKLVYNSSYGKCAQSVGIAKYANPIYASLITAGCRKLILDAISLHPDKANAVLMIATDGIAFRTEHPNLHLDNKELGAWSHSLSENLTLFMPGMYWDDNTRDRLERQEDPALKSRGVNARSLANEIKRIDEAFRVYHFPKADLDINFSIVSPIQALARGKWETAGNVSTNDTRTINSSPDQKRYPHKIINRDGLRRTIPYQQGPTLESTPYEKRFGLEMTAIQEMEELTPDGGIMMLFAHALGLR